METFIKKGEYKRLYNNTYLMVDVMDYRGCVIAKFYDTELADEYIAFKMGKNKPVEIPEISDTEIGTLVYGEKKKIHVMKSKKRNMAVDGCITLGQLDWINLAINSVRQYREELKKRLK